MFLLFRAGLEVRASDLVKVGKTASVVAILGVIVPLAMGYGIYRWSGASNIESLFAGAAMVATSVGITAQVLARWVCSTFWPAALSSPPPSLTIFSA